MLAKRIIPCLDIKDGETVKGINFLELRGVGDPVALGRRYAEEGADELVYLDISATFEGRKTFAELVTRIAGNINIPFTVGGGISTVDDAGRLLGAGADKVSINSAAVRNPESFAAQYTLGRLYAADPARYTDALPALTRAASLRGFKDRGTLVMLANTLVAQRSPSAMSWLNTLVRVAPELESEAAYHNLLGIAQAHARRPDAPVRDAAYRVRQAFTRAYQLDRNNPTIVYNIGTFFDRYASNPRAAASFYRKFLELAGEDAAFAARKSEVTARLARIR